MSHYFGKFHAHLQIPLAPLPLFFSPTDSESFGETKRQLSNDNKTAICRRSDQKAPPVHWPPQVGVICRNLHQMIADKVDHFLFRIRPLVRYRVGYPTLKRRPYDAYVFRKLQLNPPMGVIRPTPLQMIVTKLKKSFPNSAKNQSYGLFQNAI